MKKWLTESLYFSKTERVGAGLLAGVVIVVLLAPSAFQNSSQSSAEGLRQFQDEVNAFRQNLQDAEAPPQIEAEVGPPPSAKLFYFDPNTLPLDSLLLLGLPRRTAYTLINYREKVGPFGHAEELKKLYTLSEEDYLRLQPYISIHTPPARGKVPEQIAATSPKADLFPFDPNTLPEDSLNLLGLPPRAVKTLVNYRSKGGQFRSPEDLGKLYGLEAEDKERLLPWVRIAPRPSDGEGGAAKSATAQTDVAPMGVDINKDGPEAWQALPGIGPAYARRICGFREKLGGFSSIAQIKETYGLPDSTFEQIRPLLKHSAIYRKISINTADAAALQRHPYLGWKEANAIVAYRSQHGPFQSGEDVEKILALPLETKQKMAPYWDFEKR